MSGHTDNHIVINAPMDLVWDMTNDIESWPQLFTEYSEATVLERREGAIRFRLALHPDENGIVWSWISDRMPDKDTRTVRSLRVETGPFKYMFLYWEYLPVDGGVRMRWVQDFEMKPQAPIDDVGMTARLNTNSAAQLAIIRDKIEAAAASLATR
ncbi:SRPBCC family protein [Nocardia sp. CDC153]|uniref:SRPBCC family protein n=1 Tax=Nocardia sp. CDC153 TaxID=3112167 RepID=UPI002DB93F64|nr:SRPBCC family protein [Nocardia sp. CDC153]MEC3952021.1 SRPBCC family protein [Nocardia sp. CDC153]